MPPQRILSRSGNYSDEDVKEAILQVCSEIDKPDPPGPGRQEGFLPQDCFSFG